MKLQLFQQLSNTELYNIFCYLLEQDCDLAEIRSIEDRGFQYSVEVFKKFNSKSQEFRVQDGLVTTFFIEKKGLNIPKKTAEQVFDKIKKYMEK